MISPVVVSSLVCSSMRSIAIYLWCDQTDIVHKKPAAKLKSRKRRRAPLRAASYISRLDVTARWCAVTYMIRISACLPHNSLSLHTCTWLPCMSSNGAASSQSVGHHTAMDRWRKLVFDFDAMGGRWVKPAPNVTLEVPVTADMWHWQMRWCHDWVLGWLSISAQTADFKLSTGTARASALQLQHRW